MKKLSEFVFTLFLLMFYFNATAQWEKLSDAYTTEVFVSDTNIFIGTNDGNINLSKDFGQTWTSIKNNLPDLFIDNIGICASNKLICSCGRFIYTSENWADWEQVYQVSNNITSMVIDGSNIYIGVEFSGGIHASFDNGNTWTDISSNLINKYITSVSVRDTTLLVSVYGSDQIYRTDNYGTSWIVFNQGTDNDAIFSMVKYSDFYAGGDNWIFKLDDNQWKPVLFTGAQVVDFAFSNSCLCGVGSDVYITSDSGFSWTTIETPYTDFWIKAVEIYNGYILAGNSTGLYRYPLPQLLNSSDPTSNRGVDIFPNPCNDIFYVRSTSGLNDNVSVLIRSLDGNLILSKTFETGERNCPIKVSELVNGLYMVQIVQGDSIITKKIIIER